MTAPPKSRATTWTAAPSRPARAWPVGWRPAAATAHKLALTALIANVAIVASGGLVRLTGSGLGCPSWPSCAGSSLVPTRQLSWHKYVEFGNRLFTYVVLAAAVAALVCVMRERPRRAELQLWAWLVFLGVPAQAVMGGVTVLTDLNPWAVAAHFVLSMALVGAATVLWWRTRAPDRAAPDPGAPDRGAPDRGAPDRGAPDRGAPALHPLLRGLAWAVWALTYAVFCVGTVVTGSGPHAGDPSARRIDLKPASVAQLHTDLVMLLVGTSVALAVAVTAFGADRSARTTTRVLVGTLVFQAVIGFTQYFTKLPIGLVELHLLGSALIAVAATAVVACTTPAGMLRRSNADWRAETLGDRVGQVAPR